MYVCVCEIIRNVLNNNVLVIDWHDDLVSNYMLKLVIDWSISHCNIC